jgi:hypothetical protein
MEIQFFNSIFFWKKYFKDLLKIFVIELKETIYYYYLKLIILYPGVLIVILIISLNMVYAVTMTYGDIMTNNEWRIYPNYIALLKKHVLLSGGLPDLDAALSIASFEPNPEYLYLYRLERKIELINLLIQKIKNKNPTHLNLDWTKTLINRASDTFTTQCFVSKMLLYARLYDPNLYNLEAKSKLDYEESNKIIRIMVGEDTVLFKFDQALQIITFDDSEVLRKTTLPIYDCRLLFGEKQGLINFSQRYQNFTFMDLCTLECFVGQIVHLLISHYWILPENVDLEGECYLRFCWPENYFISINGEEISTHWYSWKRSQAQVGLIKSMSEILLETMDKEDSYSKIMLGSFYYFGIEPFVEAKRNGEEFADSLKDVVDNVDNIENENYLDYLRTCSISMLVSIIRWLYYGK